MVGQDLVEVAKLSVDWTLLECGWIPTSPRLVTLGSSHDGEGRLAVLALSGQGLTQVSSGGGGKALRCGTFRGLKDRMLLTGDFAGRIQVWDLEDLSNPVETVTGHDDLINCISGGEESHRLVTGARDGKVRIWDTRSLRSCVANIQGEEDGRAQDCWSVDTTPQGNILVAAFSNGDVRMFDMRQAKAAVWETALPQGVPTLCLQRGKGDKLDRLVGGTQGGRVCLWDLQTLHTTQGYTRVDQTLDRGCVWRLEQSPHQANVMVGAVQGGALEVITYKPPGHRVMIAADGGNMGTPGLLERGISKQLTDKPVTSISWCPDKCGLLACTCFDQSLRVCILTGLEQDGD